MVVKRQKSDANLNNGKQVAVTNGTAVNGALIQAVSSSNIHQMPVKTSNVLNIPPKEGPLIPLMVIDTANKRPPSPHNGAHGYSLPHSPSPLASTH